MTMSNCPVSVDIEQQLGVITIDYPPVNALGHAVRQGLWDAIEQLQADNNCKVILIQCLGRTFIAGADIKEFAATPQEPHLPDLVNHIEACHKPVIASLFGTTLGGGFEVALACHYRLALADSKVGLPEVKLGLIPGAGGTQRLMRIVGIEKALQMISSGNHVTVSSLQDTGLFDGIFSSFSDNPVIDLQQMSRTFCQQLISNSRLTVDAVGKRTVTDDDFDWDAAKVAIIKKARGQIAAVTAFEVIRDTWNKNITAGMAIEREQFLKLRDSEQSAALRHAFAAERKAAKLTIPATALSIKTVGIIGGGTMGAGICTSLLNAGFTVCLIEQTDSAIESAVQRISNNFASSVKRGRITQLAAEQCLKQLTTSTDYHQLASCQLIIEAIFEDIAVKKALFKELDSICEPTTLFASNTSYLDINEIAAATRHPERVLGMHFFSPAHIMKLLEVVEAEKSSATGISTAMQVGKQLGKVSVLVKVCFGFAGNRMYSRYGREIQQMLLEGAKVAQIDAAMTDWGMAMGPLAVQDLSGIDIGYKARKSRAFPEYDPGYFKAAEAMVENGRLGRKTQAGFYRYDDNGQQQADPEVDRLISEQAQQLAIKQHSFSNDEIVHRALYAIVSEGLQLYQEGIVQRLSDIDVIWLHGYGFPRYRGGPMFQAQTTGPEKLNDEFRLLQQQYGKIIWPDVNYEH